MNTRRLLDCAVMGAVAAGLLACQAEVETQDEVGLAEQASICGTNNLQHVEQYDGTLGPSQEFVMAHQSPVFNVKWKNDLASRYTNPGDVQGARWCTGTMISADLGILAGHCFDPDNNGWTWPRSNATGQPITPAEGALEMQVDFNYQLDPAGVARTPTTFNVSELVEYRLGNLDYAVIRLAGNPGATFKNTTISPFPLALGQLITIIQHPSGEQKQIHAGPVASVSPTWVTYSDADTLGGSSGSGVLNTLTGYIAAIHTTAGCTVTGGANQGVPVSAIYGVSPTVRTASFDTAKLMVALQ
ncbi:MAG: serine protease [Polyangiaceae bacterium]